VAAVELICVACLLALAIGILSLMPERHKEQFGWKAVLVLALGGSALAIPATIAFHAHL